MRHAVTEPLQQSLIIRACLLHKIVCTMHLFRAQLFKTLALAGLLAFTSPAALHAQASPRPASALPTLGDSSELAAAEERRIGDRIAASIYRDPDYIDDPVLFDYVQSIWQPLMAAARARGEITAELDQRFAWDVFLIRDRSINAFALPGGYLGVHLGLIGVVSNRDELAAVLGHELSHVSQRHISRLISQQAGQAPWMIGSMILGLLAASKNPQLANAVIASGQAVSVQTQLNFSRDMEREADRVGSGVMLDAGFDPRGVMSMFEKLQQAARLNDSGGFAYLRTHPLSTERIGDAQARQQLAAPIEAKPAKPGGETPQQIALQHAMMSARARVLGDPGVDMLRAMMTEAQGISASASAAEDMRSVAALYAGVLAALKSRDFKTAQTFFDKLRAVLADNPADSQVGKTLALLQLEVALEAGQVPADAAQLDISNSPARAALLLQSRALLAAGKPKDVASRLSTWVADHPKDAAAWRLLVLAFSNQNLTARSVRADAEAQVAQLDYPAALDRLRAAQAMLRSNPASGDFMDASIIDARARQVDSLVREQARQDKVDRKLQQ
jgi:predicted Zn-dependent protease